MALESILFLSSNDWGQWGGSEELWSQAALAFRRQGYKISIHVKWFGSEPPQIHALRMAGCSVIYRNNRPSIARGFRRLVFGDVIARSGRLFKRHGLVVINQGANFDGLLWMKVCQKVGVPYVVIAHAAAAQWWQVDQVADLLAQAYENAIAAYFVSERNRALTERQFGVQLRNAHIVRNPVNVIPTDPPPWPGGQDDCLRLACVGRLEPMAKGQDLIIEVLRHEHWRRRAIRVTLFGRGANEQSLRRACRIHSVETITFGGFAKDVASIWATHHALLLPSRYEGLPITIVESMLCNRASIVTDVGGNCEVVKDDVTGFVAPAATTAFLDEALDRAWKQRYRLQEMGLEAGKAIRRIMPPDPVKDFCEMLKAAMGEVQ